MPNNLVVDISSINYAISRVTNIQNKLNAPTSKINGQKTSFANTSAANVQQLKIFAKSYNSRSRNFTASTKSDKKRGSATLTGKISFESIGFTETPVVCLTLDVPTDQRLNAFVSGTTTDAVEITIIKTDGSDWGKDRADLNFNINVIAIGYGN